MRLVEVTFPTLARPRLELHPHLTVVTDLEPEQRAAVADGIAAALVGYPGPLGGVIEVHGERRPLDVPTLQRLELDPALRPCLYASDLPGAQDPTSPQPPSSEDASALSSEARAQLEEARAQLEDARRHLDEAKGRRDEAEWAVASELALLADLADPAPALGEARVVLLGAVQARDEISQEVTGLNGAEEQATVGPGAGADEQALRAAEGAVQTAAASVQEARSRVLDLEGELSSLGVPTPAPAPSPPPSPAPSPPAPPSSDGDGAAQGRVVVPATRTRERGGSPADVLEQLQAARGQLVARRTELTRELGAIEEYTRYSSTQVGWVAEGADHARAAAALAPVPSPEAGALADGLERLAAELAAAQRPSPVPESIITQARDRLERARFELAQAEMVTQHRELTAEDEADLEAAHAAVIQAEQRLERRSVGAAAFRRRLDAAIAIEQGVLERLGFSSYTGYLLQRTPGLAAPDDAQRLSRARATLADAEAVWEEIHAFAGERARPDTVDVERAALLEQAVALLGFDPGRDVVAALRGVLVAPDEVATARSELVAVLDAVGLDLGRPADEADFLEVVLEWLERAGEAHAHAAGMAAALEGVDAELAELDAELAELQAEARFSNADPAPAAAAGAMGAGDVDVDLSEAAPRERPIAEGAAAGAAAGAARLQERSRQLEGELAAARAALARTEQRLRDAERVEAEARRRMQTQAEADDLAAGSTRASRERSVELARLLQDAEAEVESASALMQQLEQDDERFRARHQHVRELADAAEAANLAVEEAMRQVDQLVGNEPGLESRRGGGPPDLTRVDVKDAELYVLSRLAMQRAVGLAGSIPIVINDAFHGVDQSALMKLLTLLDHVAVSLQVIYLTDQPEVASWATRLGRRRAAVTTLVAPPPPEPEPEPEVGRRRGLRRRWS